MRPGRTPSGSGLEHLYCMPSRWITVSRAGLPVAVPLWLLAALLGLAMSMATGAGWQANDDGYGYDRVDHVYDRAPQGVASAQEPGASADRASAVCHDCPDAEATVSASASAARGETRTLYHYTSEAGEQGIRRSGRLNPSLNPPSARYGPGQYLTDIAPTSGLTRGQTARRLFGQPFAGPKLDRCIEINVCGLPLENPAANIFRVPGTEPLDISRRIVGSGPGPG